LVRLGSHPEVGVCLRCAHFLHQQAGQREDVLRPSIAGRLRDGLRWGRRLVMQHGWHQRPVIGRPLRWVMSFSSNCPSSPPAPGLQLALRLVTRRVSGLAPGISPPVACQRG
jgi:hypothetical protein